MRWEDLPETVDAWAAKTAGVARDLQRAAASVYTRGDVGYYFNPLTEKAALHGRDATPADLALCQATAARAAGRGPVRLLEPGDLARHPWVKVAYSPAVRRAGELLNFFPGQYPGGVPNAPSPVAAMLTSALVGGGLGYGTGWLAGKLLPKGYGDKLKRTGGVLGALLGAAPGSLWLASNLAEGKGPLDGSALAAPPSDSYAARLPSVEGLHPTVKLGSMYARAVETFVKRAFADSFGGFAPPPVPTPYDVNINALGQTLWHAGAAPPTAGTVMGTMYAAQQLPDPRSRPGWVTAGQLGQLAANAGKDYLTGALVGAAINTAIGTPFRASSFGAANATLGIIKAVIPKLFS